MIETTSQTSSVVRCWESARSAQPAWTGRVRAHLTTSATGTVTAAEIDVPPGGPPKATCLAAAARRWRFPAHDAASAIELAFDLSYAAPD